MAFTLPDLPYDYNALEPYIDEQTMRIHHGKHHGAYVTNLNKALESHPDLAGKSIEDLCRQVNTLPADIRTAVRNNGGGHYNHALFWQMLAPANAGGGGRPAGDLAAAIQSDLGGFDAMKDAFTKAALGRFGSGWAWIILGANSKLAIISTPNQDNPLMTGVAETTGTPILGLDVWEHAYYLKYQNRRNEYVENWWNIINWKFVADLYARAKA